MSVGKTSIITKIRIALVAVGMTCGSISGKSANLPATLGLNSLSNLVSPPSPTPLIDVDFAMRALPNWEDDFEYGWRVEQGRGSLENQSAHVKKWRFAQMQIPESGKVVMDPENPRNQVMQFHWRNAPHPGIDGNTQRKAHLFAGFGLPKQEEIWAFRAYFPARGMESDRWSEILVQWHAQPDRFESSARPPLAMDNRNDRLTVTWLHDPRRFTPPGSQNHSTGSADLGPTAKDAWIPFVFHIKWDPHGAGILRVWRDHRLVVDRRAIGIGYHDEVGPYFGVGIYKFENRSQHPGRTVLFDDIKQWIVTQLPAEGVGRSTTKDSSWFF